MTFSRIFLPSMVALALTAAVSAPAGAQDQPAAGFAREVFGTFAFDYNHLGPDAGGFNQLALGGGVRLRRKSPLGWECGMSHGIAGEQPTPVGVVGFRIVTATTLASANLSYFFFGKDGERRAAPFLGGGVGVLVRHDLTNVETAGGRLQILPEAYHDTRWDGAVNVTGGVRIAAGKHLSITPEARLYLSGSPFTVFRGSVSAGYHW
jgi:hypothetical protein